VRPADSVDDLPRPKLPGHHRGAAYIATEADSLESFFTAIEQRWPAGRADYHWHVLPGADTRHEHVTLPYRDLVHRAGLAPVAAAWTHVTVEHLAPVGALSSDEIARIIELVRNRCARLAPLELTIGRAEIWGNGVVCPVSPARPLRQLREITTAASREVTGGRFGTAPAAYHPHLALAYAVSDVHDAPLRAWLSRHEVPEASLPVRQLSLVAQEHDGGQITWRPIRAVPLGGSPPDAAGAV
jgi:2'-5' RNA ligase